MAYMNREHKARIRLELLKVIPKDWKWGLTISDNTTIVLTIKSAPVDLCRIFWEKIKGDKFARGSRPPTSPPKCFGFSYANHIDQVFTGEIHSTFMRILEALNLDNYDNSDPSTDYFDIGHYAEVSVGTSNEPFAFDEAKILSEATAKPNRRNGKTIRV